MSTQYCTKMLIYEGSYALVNIFTDTVLYFENESRVFYLISRNFKIHNFVLRHLKNLKPDSAPTIRPCSLIILHKTRGSELRLSL